ncbi:hypothetical protein MJL33_29850, partial [Salmonella enterica subsp. enterica serovar Kentucky]|nr:hypothetical protein [Salmonella enterica subsp. enterica serovar Kentucky]
LTASGNIQADAPLKPTVNGQLHAVNAQKQQITQTMQAGVVSGSGPYCLLTFDLRLLDLPLSKNARLFCFTMALGLKSGNFGVLFG